MDARKKSRSFPRNRGKYAQAGKRVVNLFFYYYFLFFKELFYLNHTVKVTKRYIMTY